MNIKRLLWYFIGSALTVFLAISFISKLSPDLDRKVISGWLGYWLAEKLFLWMGEVGVWCLLLGLIFITLFGYGNLQLIGAVWLWILVVPPFCSLFFPSSGGILGDSISQIFNNKYIGLSGAYIINILLLLTAFIWTIYSFKKNKKEEYKENATYLCKLPRLPTSTRERGEKGKSKKYSPPVNSLPLPPASDKKPFTFLPLELITVFEKRSSKEIFDSDEEERRATLLEETLASFGVEAKVVSREDGPIITRYELKLAKGVRVNKITNLADDIALALATPSVRIEAPIPGKSVVGIEIPHKSPRDVFLGEILSTPLFQNSTSKLTFGLGKDIAGNPVVGVLDRMPHLLIAGTTGAGKSVCLNAIIVSILFRSSPDEVHFAMIDPKRVELTIYKDIPHLVSINQEYRVVVDPLEASELLKSIVLEMDYRYRILSENKVRNIYEFNKLPPSKRSIPPPLEDETHKLYGLKKSLLEYPMPFIVVVIDELADLMMVAPVEVEKNICRLAQLARAVGIHLLIATQRPSVNVITGIIKANIPARIAFAVSSQVDSRTILDMSGAEKLLGRGDMLYLPVGVNKPVRLQGAYIGLEAIEAVVNYWREKQPLPPENITDFKVEVKESEFPEEDFGDKDPLLGEAVDIVLQTGIASVSQLQRKLKIGHARAGRLIDLMEKHKIVGPWEGSKPRKILVKENPFPKDVKEKDF